MPFCNGESKNWPILFTPEVSQMSQLSLSTASSEHGDEEDSFFNNNNNCSMTEELSSGHRKRKLASYDIDFE